MLTIKLYRPQIWRPPKKYFPVLANMLMLVLLSYLFSRLGTHILNYTRAGEVPGFTIDTENIPRHFTVTSGNTGRKIASMHLFGKLAEKKKVMPKKHIAAPETKLNLTLRGIIAQGHKYQGLAIIQNNNQKNEKYFSIKDRVFGLATLEEIYEDRVILLRNRKFETLRLPENALPRKHFLNSDAVKAARKRVASDYRNRFLSRRGMDLIKLFGFKPLHRNGGFTGFTVTALGEEGKEMLETLGVMEGDLITVVNGMRLSESLEAVAKLKELKTATSIDVIIERDGNEIPFNFELDPPPAELAGTTETAANIKESGAAIISENGTVAKNNPTTTTGNTSIADDDEDLGEDWGVSEEDQQYMEELKASVNHPPGRHELEYDH